MSNLFMLSLYFVSLPHLQFNNFFLSLIFLFFFSNQSSVFTFKNMLRFYVKFNTRFTQ